MYVLQGDRHIGGVPRVIMVSHKLLLSAHQKQAPRLWSSEGRSSFCIDYVLSKYIQCVRIL